MIVNDSNSSLPPLKGGLEAVQIEHEGQPLIFLRDHEGITQKTIALSLGAFILATMLNGRNSISDLQKLFTQSTGSLISEEEIKNLVGLLGEADLLETPQVQEKRKEMLEMFFQSPVRKPQHLGTGYPADRIELAAFLGKFCRHPRGPQKEIPSAPLYPKPPLGLIAPHIDFERGGPIYAWAYEALAECPPPDLIVAIGVAHNAPDSPWVMTAKDYETPYGSMEVDKEIFREINRLLWYDPLTDEFVHRNEHSLEFQALWLKYLWQEKAPQWIPILCSAFERFCPDKSPSTVDTVDHALTEIGNFLRECSKSGKRIMILAGVDLSHVGPKFGDNLELTQELRSKIEKEDRESLAEVQKISPDSFYLSVVAKNNWRKVCGLSAIYTALRLIRSLSDNPQAGELLAYDQEDDPMGGVVSFAGMIFR